MTIDDSLFSREWLETNGIGGWASSTVSGAHTRRYHGLLVAATRPPVGRQVLLSKLDETLIVGEDRFELSCNRYPGTIHPRGFEYLSEFSRGLFPSFVYQAGGVRLRKTIAALQGENTTVIRYEVEEAPAILSLHLRPFVAFRDYHCLARANPDLRASSEWRHDVLKVRPYESLPELFIFVPGGTFTASPDWYYRFEYVVEIERGLDAHEDLFTHGVFGKQLSAGERLDIVVSTEDPRGKPQAESRWAAERCRREELLQAVGEEDDFARTLVLAADQFIVRRGVDQRTIIAGYHWFSDWGRDTMISLPGLCLATRRFDDARDILRTYASHLDRGMLPNRFPDHGEEPEYNTVDGTLWYAVAVYQYWQATRDDTFVQNELLPVLKSILHHHHRGTRYGIGVDRDGLLRAGDAGTQLTWMDARVGDHAVTPRFGKPVEINALWYNLVAILAELESRFGNRGEGRSLHAKAGRVKQRFEEVFWHPDGGYLFDVVNGTDRDATLRPNQILALSLPFALLDEEKALRILNVVERELFTPFGLRSLAPREPGYAAAYTGGPHGRDHAYHQGTVWAWLLGPYLACLIRYRGAAGQDEAQRILALFEEHLAAAGVGTVSEIFDADPPHTPRGCIAQAWSVGEILRVRCELSRICTSSWVSEVQHLKGTSPSHENKE